MENLTKEDIIKAYHDEVAANPDMRITRNYFREIVPENQIVKHFGSFSNLQTQLGERPTRTAFKEMRAYEKHKSVENLTDYNKEKFSWNNKYDRTTNNNRFKSIISFCDMHDLKCDPFYYRMAIQAVKAGQPDKIILNGDIVDLPEFSKYNVKVSEFKPVERLKWLDHFLKDLRNASPDSEINYIEGNHEYRLIHHLLEKSTAYAEILDYRGVDIRKILGLDEYQINYYSRADIGTFTEADIRNELKKNHYIAYDNVVFYHYPEGRTRFGMPGVSGHHHKYQVWADYNHTFGTYNWIQSGAGAIRHADFTDSSFCWQNGFVQVLVDTQNKKNLLINYIDCTGEICYADDLYFRTEEEKKFISNM